MSAVFDPYHRWLGIASDEQPPHHYRLLGLKVFEGDADVIESAADRQMAHVRGFQAGKHAADAERILNEISAARLALLQAEKKTAYDAQLRAAIAPRKQQRAAERSLPVAQPLGVEVQPKSMLSVAAPVNLAAPLPTVRTPTARGKRSANSLALVAGAGGVLALLIIAGAVLAIARPWEAASDEDSPPLTIATTNGTTGAATDDETAVPPVEPPPFVPPVLPPGASEEQPPKADPPPATETPVAEPPKVDPPTEPPKEEPQEEFRIPLAHYDAAKSVLVICEGSERNAAVKACGEFGLKGEPGRFDAARSDYTKHHTIITGSNAMDYWGGDRGKPEAFAAIEKFVADGGHLIVTGGFNGRNMHHMRRFGIHTGFQHGNGFRPVSEHTDVFFRGAEHAVPKNNHLKSAGHFWVTKPHIVLLQRTDKWGPALVTLPWEQGRVTFTQVEPHWQGDEWLITVLLGWVARGAPTRADDREYSPRQLTHLPAGLEFRPPETKLPLPAKADLDQARTELDSIFPENASATREEKIATCEQMLKLAVDPKMESPARFELLGRVRVLAADAAQVRLAFAAIDILDAHYEFDAAPLRSSTLARALKAPAPAAAKRDTVVAGLEVLDGLIERDEYDAAVELVAPLLDAARRVRDRELVSAIADRRQQAEDLLAAHARVAGDLEKLKTDPDDAAANLAAGKFYLLAKRHWQPALECFAKGSDAQLVAAAQGELARPTDTAAKRALGDAWWQLAEAERHADAERVYRGLAALWYLEAAGELKGLDAATIRRRADEISAADLAAALNVTLAQAATRDVTFLDDVREAETQVAYPLKKHNPDQSMLGGQTPAHAVDTHAKASGEAFVRYELDGSYDLVRGTAGIWMSREPPSSPNAESPLVFSIEADGKTVWKSRPMQKHGDGQPFEVIIRGVRILKLRVDCAGGNQQAWSTWADPQIVRSKLK